MLNVNTIDYYQTYNNMLSRYQQYQTSSLYQPFHQPVYTPSPFFTPMISLISMKSTIMNISGNAKGLQMNADELRLENGSSLLHDRLASTSNKDVINASAKHDASIEEYAFEIYQLAKTQQNTGTVLNKDALTNMSTGTNTFRLTSGDTTKTLYVDIIPSDTNESALKKVAAAITNAKMGVTAAVSADTTKGTVKLNIESSKTGSASSFSIADVSGNAVSTSGAGQTVQQAVNAKYSINGSDFKESQSNTLSIDGGKVEVTFKNNSSKPETISITGNNEAIVNQTKALVDSYNDLVETIGQDGSYFNTSFKRSVNEGLYSYRLDQIGIEKSANGKLKLDEDKLMSNLQRKDYSFDRTINNIDVLADQLYKTGSRIAGMPAAAMIDLKNLLGSFNSYPLQNSPMYSGIFYDQYF